MDGPIETEDHELTEDELGFNVDITDVVKEISAIKLVTNDTFLLLLVFIM